MAIRNKNPAIQHFNKISPHSVLAGGRMFFFEPGSSTTKKDTFTNSDGATGTGNLNTNPVILDASGFEPDIFGEGSYRVELRSSIADGNLFQWERDPVNFSSEEGAFGDWLSTVDYGVAGDNIVVGSDGNYYVSIVTPNINNDPTTSPAFWTEFDLLKRWNTNETYNKGDPVVASNGIFYTSAADGNTGIDPITETNDWLSQNISEKEYIINANFINWLYATSAVNPTGANEYNTVDRFRMRRDGAVTGMSIDQRQSGVDDSSFYALNVYRTSGDTNVDDMNIMTVLESIDSAELQGKVVTVEFRLRLDASFSSDDVTLSLNSGTGEDESPAITDGAFATGNVPFASSTAVDVGTLVQYQTAAFSVTVPSDSTQLNVRATWTPKGVASDSLDGIRFHYISLREGNNVGSGVVFNDFPKIAQTNIECRRYARKSDVNTRVAEYTEEMRAAPSVDAGPTPFLYSAEL